MMDQKSIMSSADHTCLTWTALQANGLEARGHSLATLCILPYA